MDIKKSLLLIGLLLISSAGSVAFAEDDEDGPEMDNFGQAIKISTDLKSFRNYPSWTLIIRDMDHGQNIPYLFDFADTNNFWLVFTYSINYTILSSTLSFSPEGRTINNFCHLEGMGRILHSKGISIHLTGKLTPRGNAYQCNVSRYPETSFTVVRTEE